MVARVPGNLKHVEIMRHKLASTALAIMEERSMVPSNP